MDYKYHVSGTCQVKYPDREEPDEIYISVVVETDSEVNAITAVANELRRYKKYQSFVWQSLMVEIVDDELDGVASLNEEESPIEMILTP